MARQLKSQGMQIFPSSFELVTILLCGRKNSEFSESVKLTKVEVSSFCIQISLLRQLLSILYEKEQAFRKRNRCPFSVQSGHRHLYSIKADGRYKQLKMELVSWCGFLVIAIKLSASGLLLLQLLVTELGSGFRFQNHFYLMKQIQATVVKVVSHTCCLR